MELEPALEGNKVDVLVEEMDGGNYSCHLKPNGEYLNHTVILVQLQPPSRPVILEDKSPKGKLRKLEEGWEERGNKFHREGNRCWFVVPLVPVRGMSPDETWEGCHWIAETRKLVGEVDKLEKNRVEWRAVAPDADVLFKR